ncbi:hypothetical protein MBLNU459_g5002t3 [Dothideomycetes sp. NU459]
MGISGLWDILGDGEITALADLATDHFRRTGRPLRLAVDEAGWRFNNLNKQQVAFIREKEPAANPIEKAIMFRLLRMMRLNIQFLFVFDGPGRPWKRGGNAGRIDWKEIDLLRQLLNHLCIPHHRAPAEAEAECARLEGLGIVDGVYSDDSDTLMFGCKLLIRDHRVGPGKGAKKSDTHVRVYRADKVLENYGLDRAALVLFALLSGGDYDAKGLQGCGAVAAHEAAKFDGGRLGKMLMVIPLSDLHLCTEELRIYFGSLPSRRLQVPDGYPRELHVRNYRSPRVSTPEQIHSLRCLRHGWNKDVDEGKLRNFLRDRFNIWTKGYIKHVIPTFLVRALANTASDETGNNAVFGIKMVPRRGKAAQNVQHDRRITFNAQVCTNLDLTTQPTDEDWSKFTGKDGIPFDPLTRAEAETLDCILERGLGSEIMRKLVEEANQPATRKRKSKAVEENLDGADQASSSAPKRQKSTSAAGDAGKGIQEPNVRTITPKVGANTDSQSKQATASTTRQAKRRSRDAVETGTSLSAAAAKERESQRSATHLGSDRTTSISTATQHSVAQSQGFRLPACFDQLSVIGIDAFDGSPNQCSSLRQQQPCPVSPTVVLDVESIDEELHSPTPPRTTLSAAKKSVARAGQRSKKAAAELFRQDTNTDGWDELCVSLRKLEHDYDRLSDTFEELTALIRRQGSAVSAGAKALAAGLKASGEDIRRDIELCKSETPMDPGVRQFQGDVVAWERCRRRLETMEECVVLFRRGLDRLATMLGKSKSLTESSLTLHDATGSDIAVGNRSSVSDRPILRHSSFTGPERGATQPCATVKPSCEFTNLGNVADDQPTHQRLKPVGTDDSPSTGTTREKIARARLRHFQSLESSTPLAACPVAPKKVAEVIDLT